MSQNKKTVTLISQNKEVIGVDFEIACISQTINYILKEFSFSYKNAVKVPLKNINSKTLVKIIEFCRYELEISKKEDFPNLKNFSLEERTARQKNWKTSFFRVNDSSLFHLTTAAAFLEIESLIDQTTKIIARKLTKKNIFQIKKNQTLEKKN
mmetsp:Transcript_33839/g.67703  ORF Transcript_33839/g.67703 Transcript_33839/m.67703 type:complete len:153 (-) Transcript_33839:1228-1686(-)